MQIQNYATDLLYKCEREYTSQPLPDCAVLKESHAERLSPVLFPAEALSQYGSSLP